MTIKTSAKELPGLTDVTDLKKIAQELQLGIMTAKGKQLGTVRISRHESSDQTTLSFETTRKSLESMLQVEGFDEPLDLTKKIRSRTLERARANIQIEPSGNASYLEDLSTQRRYKSLSVMLEPTPVTS